MVFRINISKEYQVEEKDVLEYIKKFGGNLEESAKTIAVQSFFNDVQNKLEAVKTLSVRLNPVTEENKNVPF